MIFNKLKPNHTTRKRIGIILIAVGVTALLCCGLFLLFGGKLLINPGQEIEPWQDPFEQISVNESISIPGFESMAIPAGKTTVPATFYNPEENKCYFEISIVLSDTKEEIYKSKLIEPGNRLYQITLNRALARGDYDAVIHYNAYTLTDQQDLNGANVPFTLVVN
jgi:hypothetical protein